MNENGGGAQNGKKVHRGWKLMSQCQTLALSFLAQVSDDPLTEVLCLFGSITTDWEPNDAISYKAFFLSLCIPLFFCVFHEASLGWYIKCHFPVVSSASFLSVDSVKLSIPFLLLSSPVSLFSTSRRVLLYSFVILIDCINLLSIEFPVHHTEHNVEYYHNPSK